MFLCRVKAGHRKQMVGTTAKSWSLVSAKLELWWQLTSIDLQVLHLLCESIVVKQEEHGLLSQSDLILRIQWVF